MSNILVRWSFDVDNNFIISTRRANSFSKHMNAWVTVRIESNIVESDEFDRYGQLRKHQVNSCFH